MQEFNTLYNTLLKHLPRPSVVGQVSVDSSGVRIAAPGIAINQIGALLKDLSGDDSFLPDDLVPEGLRIEELSLTRSYTNQGADFSFTLVWDAIDLTLGEGFVLKIARLAFVKKGRRLLGYAETMLDLDGLQLDVIVEFPSQIIRGTLKDRQSDSVGVFLAKRGIAQHGKGLTLKQLSVQASLLYQSVDIHLELETLFAVGAVSLTEATADLTLAGDHESEAAATAKLLISFRGSVLAEVDLVGAIDDHGWRLAGAATFDQSTFSIGALAKALAGPTGAPELPGVVANATVTHIAAEVDTHSEQVSLSCSVAWQHDAELRLRLEKTGDNLIADGTLNIEGLIFRLHFEKGSAQLLMGSFDAAGKAALSLDDVLKALSVSGSNGTGVSLGIRSLIIGLDSEQRTLMAGTLDAGIDLSQLGDLPLVGNLLPTDKPVGLTITPFYVAKDFDATPDDVTALLPDGMVLPDSLDEGADFSVALDLGGKITQFETNLDSSPHGAAPPTLPADNKPVASSEPLSQNSTITWDKIDAHFGPLHLSRVGHSMESSQFDLQIDAALTIGGLSVSVMGLGARYDFSSGNLTPRLSGLGLDLKAAGAHVGGSFLNLDGDFAGQVAIGTEAFSLSAIGAFKMIEGTPSMFVFGALDMPLGGPVFFFVDGLAAGFGLHRQLKMPKIEDVRKFPLVSSAAAAAAGDNEDMSPDVQIARLHDYILPQLGHHFLAAGIKFNSFKLLDGYAVLIASFGERVEIDLIGTADFATPPALPAGTPALARVGLDILARFKPVEGTLTVEARVTSNSYVYNPLCHLSGSFAFYAWFKGQSAGDFVLSLGGYHPDFKVPATYPKVPRLELKYQVTHDIYLKGYAYFALTPSVAMAGGGLHLQANIDSLRAWADLSVDFIVAWEPFHYDARVHLEIGAKWKCFHTTASADLNIWGPDFSGLAIVDWSVFEFEVSFGSSFPLGPAPISIDKFKSSFLQISDSRSANAMLGVNLVGGVQAEVNGVPVVTPEELRIGLSTPVPVSGWNIDETVGAAMVGIAPTGKKDLGDSIVTIEVRSLDDNSRVTGHFQAEPISSGVPAALWGGSLSVDKNARPIEAVTGVALQLADRNRDEGNDSPSVLASSLWADEILTRSPQVAMGSHLFSAPPDALPEADLHKLGLDPEHLVFAPVNRL